MKVKEAINIINNSDDVFSILDAENIIEYKKELASDLKVDPHRWYELSESYYEMEDGILGIYGVSRVFSEHMLASDCNHHTEAFEGEEVKIVSYKPKI